MRARGSGLFRTSLEARVFVTLTAALFAVFLLAQFLSVREQNRALKGFRLELGKSVTTLLARNLRLPIFSENLDGIASALESALRQEDVLEVVVLGESGALLAARRSASSGPAALATSAAEIEQALALFKASRAPVSWERPDAILFWSPVFGAPVYTDDESLYWGVPATAPEPVIGYVGLAVSKEKLRTGLQAILWQNLGLAGLFLLAGGFVTFAVVRQVTRPLAALVAEVRGYGAVGEEESDLRLLSATFSHLIRTLNHAFETINELRLDLEQKVEERTGELRAANQSLTATVQELRETQAQLVHSEKMGALGQVVAGVAHEVNNTVNFVSGALPALRRAAAQLKAGAPPERAEALWEDVGVLLGNVEEGARRTTAIVKDLRDFARPDEGDFELADLHRGLDSTLVLLYHEYKKRIDVVRDYGSDVPAVRCVPGQLNQVFMNVLLNAIQAIPDRGTVRVSTSVEDGRVRVRVADTGVGIAAEVLPRIFDPFFTTKEVGKGSGLGLGICHNIVRHHGGEIRVESERGRGTTFDVLLPLASGR